MDQQIGFSKERKGIAAFGGWRAPDNNVAKVLLTVAENAGLSGTAAGEASTRPRLAELVDFPGDVLKRAEKILEDPTKRPGNDLLDNLAKWAAAHKRADRDGMKAAVRWTRIATAHPWTTPDGQQSELAVDGRVYQKDHYDTWVSYLAEARQNAVSNYQFSTATEWFAEAYAAFYDPKAVNGQCAERCDAELVPEESSAHRRREAAPPPMATSRHRASWAGSPGSTMSSIPKTSSLQRSGSCPPISR